MSPWKTPSSCPPSARPGRRLPSAALLAALAAAWLGAPPLPAGTGDRFPAQEWDRVAKPEALGWSAERLQAAREYSETIGSAAVMVVVEGAVLAEWGDTSRRFLSHSLRKSLLNAIFGIHVHEGHIDLDATLAELGIDDNVPLTPEEKRATVRDLLHGRSGVYLPALALGGSLDNPPRGSHPPGTHFIYNNWDFNVLGTIFEQQTGTRLFAEFKSRIADPLGMQDFRVEDGFYYLGSHGDNVNTRFFAYPFRTSARDLARFGLLWLRRGRWGDRQVVPAAWVAESTRPHSVYYRDQVRYGYTNWRIYLKGKVLAAGGRPLEGDVYWSSGVDSHRLYVVPWADLVFVHRVNTDLPVRRPSGDQVDRLLDLILEARLRDLGAALIAAAGAGDAEVVAGLLDRGADVHAVNEQRQTALYGAVAQGHTEVVRLLLKRGAEVGATDLFGGTPLLAAAAAGQGDAVRTMLEAGADPRARTLDGTTALLEAAARGRSEVVRMLLAAGADANAPGWGYGETALTLAALNGDAASVEALIAAGAEVDGETTGGRTAAMMAEALDHREVLERLAQAGARPDPKQALLPLRAYLPPWVVGAAQEGRLWGSGPAQALLSRSVAVAAEGEAAVLVAAIRGDGAAVSSLLAAGADVNTRHPDGWTPLLLAAVNAHPGVVELLLDRGAEVEARERLMGQTALIWAAGAGDAAVVRKLLAGGARVDARDRFKGTALTQAAAEEHAETLRLLLAAGADPNARQDRGTTALIHAARGSAELVQELLNAGAEIDATDDGGRTALMAAVIDDEEEIVRVLIEAGANLEVSDRFGSTALDQARALERTAIIELIESSTSSPRTRSNPTATTT